MGYFGRIRTALSGDSVPKSVRKVAGIVPLSVDAREEWRVHLDHIATRNVADFAKSKVPAIHPADFLASYSIKHS